jgi:hypothetical protein
LPPIKYDDDGTVSDRLLCAVIAPSFVHLLDAAPGAALQDAVQTQRVQAGTLGVMRFTLLWPHSERVSKGALTRHLNARHNVHAAWDAIDIQDAARRTAWWANTVVPKMVEAGFGRWDKAADGWGFVKASIAQLQSPAIAQRLTNMLQLTPEEVATSARPQYAGLAAPAGARAAGEGGVGPNAAAAAHPAGVANPGAPAVAALPAGLAPGDGAMDDVVAPPAQVRRLDGMQAAAEARAAGMS